MNYIEQCSFPNACKEVLDLQKKIIEEINELLKKVSHLRWHSIQGRGALLTYSKFASKIEKRQHPELFFTELVWRGYDATGESIGLSQQVHCSSAIDTSMVEEATKEDLYRKYLERVAWDR